MKEFILSLILFLSVLGSVPILAQPGSTSDAPFADELRRSNGSAYFLDASEIESLLQESYESLGPGNGIVTSEQLAHRLARQLIERTRRADSLDERGCLQPLFYSHREEMYQRSPELFDDPALAGEQTATILAQQAPEVVMVEVLDARSGLFGAELGTLVRFRVEEWLKKDSKRENTIDPSYFVATDVWLDIGEATYCQARDGVQRHQSGDRYLLLGYRNSGLPEHFATGNIFPIDGGLILPQPYPLMDRRLPVSLGELRHALESEP